MPDTANKESDAPDYEQWLRELHERDEARDASLAKARKRRRIWQLDTLQIMGLGAAIGFAAAAALFSYLGPPATKCGVTEIKTVPVFPSEVHREQWCEKDAPK